MRSKSILSGVNVPIEPTSNVDSHVTNSIMIKNISYPDLRETPKKEDEPEDGETKAIYPSTFVSRGADNPYESLNTVDEYLRELYQSILLSENKKLLANLISKKSIILTKEDLEQVIKRKINKNCVVDLDDEEPTCCGVSKPFLKISNIRVLTDDGSACTDFQIQFNRDYQELVSSYHICMKFVLVN